MKPIKVISALLATAILCFSFASCSDNDDQKPSFGFNFGHNPVVTNEQGEEITSQPTEASTTAHHQKEELSSTDSTPESDTSATATTKVTTTRKPYTFPTRPTTTAEPSTAHTTVPTTQATTKPTTTSQPKTTLPVELPEQTDPPTTQGVSTDQIIENAAMAIFEYVNEERQKAGKPNLTYSNELADAAAVRSEELSESFSHIRPDGSAWNTVSIHAFGENIGYGYRNAADAMTGWMNSAGHKSNILSDKYSSIGVGIFFDKESNTYFWVQLFGD